MTDDFKTCQKTSAGTIRTPRCRLSYVYLLSPDPTSLTKKTQEPKYKCSAMIPPGCDLSLLKIAVEDAAVGKWGADKAKWPRGLKFPFLDGGEKEGPEFEGYTIIRASTRTRPGVVDARGAHVTDSAEVYSGRWAFVTLRAGPWELPDKTNRGVSLFLSNVQVLDHDEPLGGSGRVRPEKEFAPVDLGGGDADAIFS